MAARVRKKLPRPIQPRAIETAYFGELKSIVDFCHQYVTRHLVSQLPALVAEHAARGDDAHLDRDPPAQRIGAVLSDARHAFNERFPVWRQVQILKRFAARTSTHHEEQLQKQVRAAIGIDLNHVLADKGLAKQTDEFVATNVALIRTIPEQYLSQVETTVLSGLKGGQRAEEISEDLADRFDVAKSRALTIATDQTLKFAASLNAVRQMNLGVTHFTWQSVNDERTRPWHAEREGRVYSWDTGVPDSELKDDGGGDGNFPGDAVNCRCSAAPYFPDDDGTPDDE